MADVVRLDTRGRVVIPGSLRASLDLKEGDKVLMDQLDNEIVIRPIASEEKKLAKLEIEIGDDVGALAKVATYLAKNKVDLVMTQSKSTDRQSTARWDVVADTSKCKLSLAKLKSDLLKKKLAKKVKAKPI